MERMISEEGIVVDPTKIETMLVWEQSKTSSDIRSFVGLPGYYRRFIKGFSNNCSTFDSTYKEESTFRIDIEV